jgi:hypothetical protein
MARNSVKTPATGGFCTAETFAAKFFRTRDQAVPANIPDLHDGER